VLSRRALFVVSTVGMAVHAVLSLGTAIGRWRFVAPDEIGPAVPVSRADLVVVVPVPAATLHVGDVVYVRAPKQPGMLVRIDGVVDAPKRAYVVHGVGDGSPRTLPETVWQQRRAIPAAGVPFRALSGPLPTLALALAGLTLVGADVWRRRAPRRVVEPAPAVPDKHDPNGAASVALAFRGESADPARAPTDASAARQLRR
jgi:hypothetical protein